MNQAGFECVVRHAEFRDAPRISEIYNESVSTLATYDLDFETKEMRLQWLIEHEKAGFPVYVAEDRQGEVIGWSSLTPFNPRKGYSYTVENAVFVLSDYCGKGVGKKLLSTIVSMAKNMEMHSIIAKIDSSNDASIHLHKKFGYEQVGYLREAGFKFDGWRDVVILQCLLKNLDQIS